MKHFSLRRHLLASSMLLALTLNLGVQTSAYAYDENSTAAVNVNEANVGLHGYDPVSYFTTQTPTIGLTRLTHIAQNVSYHFSSQSNLDMFKANPTKYVPQFGGFCAMGVALDKKLDGDPLAWRIVDGKLYLNVNKDIQKKWLENVPGNLQKANTEWPVIKDKAPKYL